MVVHAVYGNLATESFKRRPQGFFSLCVKKICSCQGRENARHAQTLDAMTKSTMLLIERYALLSFFGSVSRCLEQRACTEKD